MCRDSRPFSARLLDTGWPPTVDGESGPDTQEEEVGRSLHVEQFLAHRVNAVPADPIRTDHDRIGEKTDREHRPDTPRGRTTIDAQRHDQDQDKRVGNESGGVGPTPCQWS